MASISTQSHLLDELERLRRKARNRLILHGCCTVMACGVLAFLTIVFLDWLLWLPAALRILGATLFVFGFFGAVWYWVIRPLRTDLTLPQVAGRVERHFGDFEDRLNSAVSFLQHRGLGSAEMMNKVVQRADSGLRQVRVDDVLTVRPLAFQASLLLLGFGVLAVLALTVGWWPAIGLNRYIYPLSEVRWPRTVEIDRTFVSPLYVPVGESLVLNLRVDKGYTDHLRAVAHLGSVTGESTARTMNRAGANRFTLVVDSISTGLRVWFEAGDDSTEDRVLEVICVPRPEVREVGVIASPPAYAARQAAVALDFSSGSIEPKQGSRLAFRVRSNKPYRSGEDALETGSLQLNDGSSIELVPLPQDPTLLTAQMDVAGEISFQIELMDRHGFRNEAPRTYRVLPVADTSPTVTIVEPTPVIEVPPSAVVSVKARATDDLGIEHLDLIVQNADGAEYRSPLALESTQDSDGHSIEVNGAYAWKLASQKLKPGDMLSYVVEATDNYRVGDIAGQISRSQPYYLKILNPLEFEKRITEELNQLGERLRKVSLEQDQVVSRTGTALQQAADKPEAAQDGAGELGTMQTRLVRRSGDLARQLLQLEQRISAAGIDQGLGGDMAPRLRAWASQLKKTAAEPMTQAATGLRNAAIRPAPETLSALEEAKPAMDQAARELKELLLAMGSVDSAADVFNRARALLDHQRELLQKTRQAGKATVGQTMDALAQELRDQLKELENEQGRLADEAAQMAGQAATAMQEEIARDPQLAKALEKSLRTLQNGSIQRHMKDASDSIGKNRTAAATSSQKLAENALREVLAGLEDRRRRQLAQLEQQLRGAVEIVEKLLEQQRVLNKDTLAAIIPDAADETFFPLSERQRLLARNASQIADELGSAPETVEPSEHVASAAKSMSTAEPLLYAAASAKQAADTQSEAILWLERALEILSDQNKKNQEEMQRNSLNRLAGELKAIRENQSAVNDETDELVKLLDEKGKLDRAESRRATLLSAREGEIKQAAAEIHARISDVPVYQFTMEQVMGLMEQIRVALDQQHLDAELQTTEDETIRRLDMLLAAIDQTLNLPKLDEFSEGSSGSGGNSPAEQQKRAIPPVAELMVLKTMQLDLNARTARHQADIGPAPTDAQLQLLKRLGAEQQQLRELTRKVTESARSGG